MVLIAESFFSDLDVFDRPEDEIGVGARVLLARFGKVTAGELIKMPDEASGSHLVRDEDPALRGLIHVVTLQELEAQTASLDMHPEQPLPLI